MLLLLHGIATLTFPTLTTAAACAAADSPALLSSCLLQGHQKRASREGALLERTEAPPEFSENRQGQRALLALRSQACQAYYQLPVASSGSLAWDDGAHLFRHKAELPANYFGPEVAYTSFRRMLTYEDVAVPANFTRVKEPCEVSTGCTDVYESLNYCLPYAVHAAQRPIKVNYLEVSPNQSLLAAAVWKCASTSLTNSLSKVANRSIFLGPHYKNLASCTAQGNLPGCDWTTSFRSGLTDARWKVATFRHPLWRFLASVDEHLALPGCGGQPCMHVVEKAQQQAERLLRDFPGQWRSCEHATQSYFLSATDMAGNPIAWDFLLEVANFSRDLEELGRLTQIDLQAMEENSSGDSDLKQQYFNAIFAHIPTICSVCKVYAQDFVCLGYDFPEQCNNENCKHFGIQFP